MKNATMELTPEEIRRVADDELPSRIIHLWMCMLACRSEAAGDAKGGDLLVGKAIDLKRCGAYSFVNMAFDIGLITCRSIAHFLGVKLDARPSPHVFRLGQWIRSRIIREAMEDQLVKPYDPEQGRKYAKYLPFWA